MLSRILIGGFMTFIGGVGVVVWGLLILVFGLGLVGAGAGGLAALPIASAVTGVVAMLFALAVGVIALIASYYYLSGGIGVMQGKSAGADKGALASSIVITLEVLGVLVQFGFTAAASGQEGGQAAAQGALVLTIVLASIRCLISGALLWWCKTAGQNLPR